MKAVAAVSLARGLSLEETMAAGLGVAIVILLFSATTLIDRVSRLIPVPIIKGIQVGAGLSLALTAGKSFTSLELNGSQWSDNLFWAVGAFVILYGTCRHAEFPFALMLFCLGCLFAGVQLAQNGADLPSIGIHKPFIPIIPAPEDFASGFGTAGLGQIPLTVLNSIIAVKYLSEDLLPDRPPPDITALGCSVGIMNLIGCWFGAMPVCHGSGGLAGQYRFGARSGASVFILGIFKILLGVFFGESLTGLLQEFPKAFLGVMVFAAGLELVMVGESLNSKEARDLDSSLLSENEWSATASAERRKDRFRIMMTTAGMFLAFRNAFIGFLAGCLCWALLELQKKMTERYSRSESGEESPLLRSDESSARFQ